MFGQTVLVCLHGMPMRAFRCDVPSDFTFMVAGIREAMPQGSFLQQVCRHGDRFDLWGRGVK